MFHIIRVLNLRLILVFEDVGMTSSEYMNRGGSCDLVRAYISSTPS
jgi:hypothetical protein